MPGLPFVGAHLIDHLDRMTEFLRTLDDRFAQRLGGRFSDGSRTPEAALPENDSEPDLPGGLLTLLQLDPNGVGALDAGEVADVCDRDRDTILEYIRISEEQVIGWRSDDADAAVDEDEREACEHEAAGWQQTVDALRAALRLITLGAPRRPQQMELFPDQPDLFD